MLSRYLFAIRGLWLCDGGEPTGGGSQGGTEPTTPGGSTGDPKAQGGQKPITETPTITETQLLQRLGKAKDAAARQARIALLGELGIDDDGVGSLKEIVAKHREGESEAARLQRELDAERKARAEHETQIKSMRDKDRTREINDALRAAIDAEAAGDKDGRRRKAINQSHVVKLLRDQLGHDEAGQLVVFKDGNPVHGATAGDLIRSLYDESPHLYESTIKPGAGSVPDVGSSGSRATVDKTSAEWQRQQFAAVFKGK